MKFRPYSASESAFGVSSFFSGLCISASDGTGDNVEDTSEIAVGDGDGFNDSFELGTWLVSTSIGSESLVPGEESRLGIATAIVSGDAFLFVAWVLKRDFLAGGGSMADRRSSEVGDGVSKRVVVQDLTIPRSVASLYFWILAFEILMFTSKTNSDGRSGMLTVLVMADKAEFSR